MPFEVIGVLAGRGQGLDATDEDTQVYVPLSAAMRRLMNVEHDNALVPEIGDFAALPAAAGRGAARPYRGASSRMRRARCSQPAASQHSSAHAVPMHQPASTSVGQCTPR